MHGPSVDISGPMERRTLYGLQVFQHFRASFVINLTFHEETVVWEEEGLLCRGTLNTPWARVHPASRCAKLCIRQQTLMEVLNSFIAWFSTLRENHQTGTARKADHSATFQKNRSALKTSLVSSLLFTQAIAGSLQPGTGFSDGCPWDSSLRGSSPFPCLAGREAPPGDSCAPVAPLGWRWRWLRLSARSDSLRKQCG